MFPPKPGQDAAPGTTTACRTVATTLDFSLSAPLESEIMAALLSLSIPIGELLIVNILTQGKGSPPVVRETLSHQAAAARVGVASCPPAISKRGNSTSKDIALVRPLTHQSTVATYAEPLINIQRGRWSGCFFALCGK